MFPPEKQTSIGLIVGLGAAASAALAAFYVLYKKDDETFELDSRLELTPSSERAIRSTTIHKSVPKEATGAVIGKGGENIKQVQRETNTKIHFINEQPDGDRIIAIKGSPTGVLEADEMIDDLIASSLSCVNRRIYIDSNEVGLVIGRSGATIKAISEETGARVNIPRNCRRSANGRVPVEIRGEAAKVEKAIMMINEKLRGKFENWFKSEPIPQTTPRSFIPSNYNVNTLTSPVMFEKFEPDVDNYFVSTFVSCVLNPSKFYLQFTGQKAAELDRLMVAMTEFYEVEENRSKARLDSIAVGNIVAAKFINDEHYYRVKIVTFEDTSDITDETEVSVFNLDFGNETIVQKRALFILHEDFLFKLPFQAIECSLFGLSPISDSGWSEDATNYFKRTTRATLWEQVLAKAVQGTRVDNEPREKYTVEIVVMQAGISLNIAQELREKGFAITPDS